MGQKQKNSEGCGFGAIGCGLALAGLVGIPIAFGYQLYSWVRSDASEKLHRHKSGHLRFLSNGQEFVLNHGGRRYLIEESGSALNPTITVIGEVQHQGKIYRPAELFFISDYEWYKSDSSLSPEFKAWLKQVEEEEERPARGRRVVFYDYASLSRQERKEIQQGREEARDLKNEDRKATRITRAKLRGQNIIERATIRLG